VPREVRLVVEARVGGDLRGAVSGEQQPTGEVDPAAGLPMLRQPVLVLAAGGDLLAGIRQKAVARELALAVYTRELFSTSHDAANRAAVAAVPAADLDLVGVGIRGPRNVVDRIVKGARKHD